MYDPFENDNYYEWVELYNPTNQSINISDWTIYDNYVNDSLEADFDHGNGTLTIPSYGYAIVTDHGTKFYDNYTLPNNTVRLYVDDKSIGNSLGNIGDKLILKNYLNEIVDSMEWIINYTDVPGYPIAYAVEGCSLSRYKDQDTNDSSQDFYEAIEPTPGYENRFIEHGETQISCNITSFLVKKDETFEVLLNVKNCGDFLDNITLKINSITYGWEAEFKNTTLSLNSNESTNVSVFVTPCNINGCKTGELTVIAESEKEYNESDTLDLFFEILAPDLWVKKIKVYDEEDFENNVFGQGKIVRIKAFLKNLGKENASNVVVSFYYDQIDDEHYIGCKSYDSVGKYQKYPSMKFDTIKIEPGPHTIFVIVDEDKNIEELDEYNNCLSFDIKIIDTLPDITGRRLIITELYYHSRPSLYNEFVTIFNPSSEKYSLSGWCLTNTPLRVKTEQTKIIFPNNTTILGNSCLIVSENAERYKWETRELPDFEYNVDSYGFVPQMLSSKKFIMPNKGCMVALKDCFNHTIDLVTYGEVNDSHSCWNGSSIPGSGEGNVLKRNINNDGFFVDTNASFDWVQNRVYRLGQSSFQYEMICFYGVVKTFVSPDCSFDTIVNELRNANESIYFNIYEFTNPFLCDELIKALIRGVSVYIFVEGSPIGGISNEEKIILSRIKDYGGQIRFISGDVKNDIYVRYRFDHAKYLVIDNETVIVESCNWAKTGIPKNPTFGNREWGVVVKNKSVANYFLGVFFDDWDPDRCDSVSFDDMGFSVSFDYFLDEQVNTGFHQPSFESVFFQGNFSVTPVFSPDTSYNAICDLIESANKSIFVQQLYIYKNWKDKINPFVEKLISKSLEGVDVKIIMNYNPYYDTTNEKINQTKKYLEEHGVEVKFVYTNWSVFTNVHNKGMIIDNRSVLISSINWNENSVMNNREAGIIIHNENVSKYYADVFFYDWNLAAPKEEKIVENAVVLDYKNTIYIVVIFTMTFALIARDWRKRKWV